MTASYTVKGETFVVDKPRVWVAKLGGTQWDLAPDGKRAVVVTPVESAEALKQEHEVVFLGLTVVADACPLVRLDAHAIDSACVLLGFREQRLNEIRPEPLAASR